MHRIEMQCAVHNVRSRAVPERLGFRLDGIRRESYRITTEFVDSAVYGLLAGEWPPAAIRAG
jgi:ribosomal-protein-serine acetyltransferase